MTANGHSEKDPRKSFLRSIRKSPLGCIVKKGKTTKRSEKKSDDSETVLVDSERERMVQSGLIRLLDSNYSDFAETEPHECFAGNQAFAGAKWRDVLISAIEYEIQVGNDVIELLKQVSLTGRSDSPFLKPDKVYDIDCRQLSNGYWVYVHFNIPDTVRMLHSFWLNCGYSDSEIHISGKKKIHEAVKVDCVADRKQVVSSLNADPDEMCPTSNLWSEQDDEHRIPALISKYFKGGFRGDSLDCEKINSLYGQEYECDLSLTQKELRATTAGLMQYDGKAYCYDSDSVRRVAEEIIGITDEHGLEVGGFTICMFYYPELFHVLHKLLMRDIGICDQKHFEAFLEFYLLDAIGRNGCRCDMGSKYFIIASKRRDSDGFLNLNYFRNEKNVVEVSLILREAKRNGGGIISISGLLARLPFFPEKRIDYLIRRVVLVKGLDFPMFFPFASGSYYDASCLVVDGFELAKHDRRSVRLFVSELEGKFSETGGECVSFSDICDLERTAYDSGLTDYPDVLEKIIVKLMNCFENKYERIPASKFAKRSFDVSSGLKTEVISGAVRLKSGKGDATNAIREFCLSREIFAVNEVCDVAKAADPSKSNKAWAIGEACRYADRVDKNKFVVMEENYRFWESLAKQADEALDGFLCGRDMIPFGFADDFFRFPALDDRLLEKCGIAWNEYVLTTFLQKGSCEYVLLRSLSDASWQFNKSVRFMTRLFSSEDDMGHGVKEQSFLWEPEKPSGIIVRNSQRSKYIEQGHDEFFANAVARILLDNAIPLEQDAALDFMVVSKMLTVRRYGPIDVALNIARNLQEGIG